MAILEGTFLNSEDVRAKAAHALGLDVGSVLDQVKRQDFVTDEDYLDACTKKALEQQTPEYRQTYRRLSDELAQRRETEQREAQAKQFAALRKDVTLNSVELDGIEREARRLAQIDLAAGRIFLHQLGESISQYAECLTDQAKDEKAARQQMNAIFRRSDR